MQLYNELAWIHNKEMRTLDRYIVHMNTYWFPFLLFFCWFGHGQIDEFSILGLPSDTAANILAVTPTLEGALAYATDENQIYIYDGSTWNPLVPPDTPTVYSGVMLVSGTGNITVSGLPFEPSNITFVAHANIETLDINSDNGVGNNDRGIANSYGSGNGFARNDSGTIVQQCIYVGGHGNSINDISRFSSSSHCIAIRYGSQNGDNLGITSIVLSAFTADGFTVNVDSFADGLAVLFTAYN